MHNDRLHLWQHSHSFGQEHRRAGESRTLIVIGITAVAMVIEIGAGLLFGSMALLADGMHMASHAAALSISAFAYIYARRHARSAQYSFGTGKVNALGGYSGAVLLVVFALLMAWESVSRLIDPVDIIFDQAILVAVLGLIVNAVCMLILGVDGHDHGHHHGHDHGHGGHDHEQGRHHQRRHDHDHDHGHGHDDDHAHDHHDGHGHDHNLRSAYLHVMADALTSVLAIVALLAAKYFGLVWMDPLMGIVGAVLVARWSLGLLRSTSGVLLDRQAPANVRDAIRESIEADGDSRIVDLHAWSIGPGIFAAQISVVAHEPATPQAYKARLPQHLGLVHVSIEVHACAADDRAHHAH